MPKNPKPLRREEEAARQLIERFLGVPVLQHDDGCAKSLPDLRIEYPDRPHAVVEVGLDADKDYMGQRDALDDLGWDIPAPTLRRAWQAQLGLGVRIRPIHKRLVAALEQAEADGRTSLHAQPYSGIDPVEAELASLQVERALSYPLHLGETHGSIQLVVANGYNASRNADLLPAWCEGILSARPDVASKLRDSGFAERHAFLFATPYGDLTSWFALNATGATNLPTVPPTLPAEIDGIWLGVWVGEPRAIAWLPGHGGWVDATL